MQKSKYHVIFVYIIINTLFILPIILFSEYPFYFNKISISWIYVTLLVFYYLLKLPYVHIILNVVIFIYYIKKEENKKAKISVLIAIILNIMVNVYWNITAHCYTVQ